MATIGRLAYQVVADTQQFAKGMVLTRNELRQAKQLFLDSRTPAEQFSMAMDALTRQFNKGSVDLETYGRTVVQLRQQLAELDGSAAAHREQLRQTAEAAKQAEKAELDMAIAAQRIIDINMSPMERYQAGLREVNQLSQRGKVDAENLMRERLRLREAFLRESGVTAQLAREQKLARLAQEQLLQAGRSAIERYLTPAERAGRQYQETIRGLNAMLKAGELNQRQYNRAVGQAQAEYHTSARGANQFAQAIQGTVMGSRLLAFATNPATIAVAALAVQAAIAAKIFKELTEATAHFAVESVKAAAKHEQLTVAFEVMTQNAERGRALLGQIEDFAKSTPFQFDEVADAGRKLLGFGTAAETVVPTLRMLGDISAGVQAPIADMVLIYGKAQQKGKLFAEELNQLAERSIPVVGSLARQFGVTEQEVRKLAEQGKISFGHLQRAFIELTSDGGLFADMMERQSQTLLGAWSNLKDEGEAILRDVGAAIMENVDLTGAVQSVAQFASELSTVLVPSVGLLTAELNAIVKSIFGVEVSMRGFTNAIATQMAFWLDNLREVRKEILLVKSLWSETASVQLEALKAREAREGSPGKKLFDDLKEARAEAENQRRLAQTFGVLQSDRNLGGAIATDFSKQQQAALKLAGEMGKLVEKGHAEAQKQLEANNKRLRDDALRQFQDMKKAASSIFEGTRTDAEKAQEDIRKLKELFHTIDPATGKRLLDIDTYERRLKQIREGIKGEAVEARRNLPAAQVHRLGSAEAFAAIERNRTREQKPNAKLEKLNESQLGVLREIEQAVREGRNEVNVVSI